MSGKVTSQLERPGFDGGEISEQDIQRIREANTQYPPETADGQASQELSLDKKFELLKNQRRRRVIRYLIQNGEASTTGELAEHVAVLENEKDNVNELTSRERKAAYVGLYQCHLPKMDDYGVIRFNQARGLIELTERAYQLQEYLEPKAERPWSLLYLGIATTGGTLYALTLLVGASAFSSLIAGLTLLAIVVTGTGHWWLQRVDA